MRLVLPILLAVACAPALAADPKPEITREAGQPQAVGVAHTLRQIPEACARIEGAFTGDPAAPYRHAVVRTSPNCQPRARLVDASKARPAESEGWILNDLLRVPSVECPTREAVVRVWRRPAGPAPERDGQGQLRVYADASAQAAAGKAMAPAMYAAEVDVEGRDCGP